jgi:hypothetical protein
VASLSSKVPRAAAEPFGSHAGPGLVALLCIRPYAVCMIKAALNLTCLHEIIEQLDDS